MKNKLKIGLLALVVLCSSVNAGTVSLKLLGVNPAVGVSYTLSGNDKQSLAGVYRLEVDGQNVSGFCIDLWKYASYTPMEYITTQVDVSITPWREIASLWAVSDPIETLDALHAAALQVSIWKVMGGTEVSFTAPQDVLDESAALSQTGYTYVGDYPELETYTSADGQNYISAVAVPEPGAFVGILGLTALGYVGFIRRKK
jgi:hypothetical protein